MENNAYLSYTNKTVSGTWRFKGNAGRRYFNIATIRTQIKYLIPRRHSKYPLIHFLYQILH